MRLNDYMHEAKLDDQGLATIIERDRSQASRLRRGLCKPSAEVAEAIARHTGGAVGLTDLLDAWREQQPASVAA